MDWPTASVILGVIVTIGGSIAAVIAKVKTNGKNGNGLNTELIKGFGNMGFNVNALESRITKVETNFCNLEQVLHELKKDVKDDFGKIETKFDLLQQTIYTWKNTK